MGVQAREERYDQKKVVVVRRAEEEAAKQQQLKIRGAQRPN